MVSAVDCAELALVNLLIRFTRFYGVVLDITCDSTDVEIRRSFKKVSGKAHPDHAGSGDHQQTLDAMSSAWEQSMRDASGRGYGRLPSTAPPPHGTSGV